MPGVSQFSTAANYEKAMNSKRMLEEAISEAKTAVAAGIPNADQLLSNAETSLGRINQFIQTYFPSGKPAE